jgi:protein gp37
MAARLSGMARKNPDRTDRVRHYLPVINAAGRWSNVVLPVESALSDPSKWRTPRLVFVNSMSDLFHADVPHEFIQRVFRVMTEHPRHQFQVLTKRAERLAELASSLAWAPNIWMGVSVEAAEYASRVDALRSTPAHVRFLSLEPLLGPLYNLELDGIHWAIVGGESGPGARRTDPNWVIDLRDQCRRAGVPFFFKQWGNLRSNPDAADPTARENSGAAKGGRQLDGRIWQEMPNGAPSPDDNKPCRVNHEET